MQDFEKLGVFYLGKTFDTAKGKTTEDLFLIESKDFTTHAVCVGMTGSGKTGLGIALLEEAGMDKIPAIIVDPKGDLTNLLLTFPNLSVEEFKPWVDEAEGERKGMPLDAFAESVRKKWVDGLKAWGEGAERIKNLRKSVEMVIYTPASRAGIPLSILSSFEAPSSELLLDTNALRERVLSTTSSLLGLIGADLDPIKSREHILISTLIDKAWRDGEDLDIPKLIQQVQKPPLTKIGAMDIDTFFPKKDRMALAVNLNNLLASPGFQAWMEGEPLDIQQLLYTPEGKPKLSVITISHLSDPERMFFVTLLLNQLIAWMRKQPGTSSTRALFYMDEIFGYFPPTAMPPSKLSMLTLLKQARAFGLGIILATQNPVDLDYKGLANCGIWFIGKLQTERDKARIIEGLNAASNGELDAKSLDSLISKIAPRDFVMRSIYHQNPVIFQTRWTMSYLRGPLTLTQIKTLMEGENKIDPSLAKAAASKPDKASLSAAKPLVPDGIDEYFIQDGSSASYQPFVGGFAKVHYADSKAKIDTWQEITVMAPPDDNGRSINWSEGERKDGIKAQLKKTASDGASFADLPSGLSQEKNYALFQKSFAAWLYENEALTLYQYPELGLISQATESEADFRARLALSLREKRDQASQKIKDQYGPKIAALNEKLRKSEEKMTQQQQQVGQQKMNTYISMGATILGALFGKKLSRTTISQTGTTFRRMGKIGAEENDAKQAEGNYNATQQQLNDLQTQFQENLKKIEVDLDPSTIKIEPFHVKPRKTDLQIDKIALIWMAK